MMYVSPWLPGLDEAAKAFFAKFLERRHTAPSSFQVGTYSAVRSYLSAVQAANSDDPKIVFAKMRETKVDDAFTPNGMLRRDGRMVHDVYLVQIKSPAESQGEWDFLKRVATIAGDKAFRPWQRAAARRLRHDAAGKGCGPHQALFPFIARENGVRQKVFFHTAATSPRLRRFVTLPVNSATQLLARHGC
jgi:hypothetical protein